ncbi:Rieske (2Fe-2S) protein [bacterium]|nr:Rieske (2Fe-2S) protein [bacterium]
MEKKTKDPFFIATRKELEDDITSVAIDDIELVAVNHDNRISVFSGHCLHEEALLADGFLENGFLTCGRHLWRYNLETGELDGEPGVGLKKLNTWFEGDNLYLDVNELKDMGE